MRGLPPDRNSSAKSRPGDSGRLLGTFDGSRPWITRRLPTPARDSNPRQKEKALWKKDLPDALARHGKMGWPVEGWRDLSLKNLSVSALLRASAQQPVDRSGVIYHLLQDGPLPDFSGGSVFGVKTRSLQRWRLLAVGGL